jgi:hypothetical protein
MDLPPQEYQIMTDDILIRLSIQKVQCFCPIHLANQNLTGFLWRILP